MGVLKQYLNFYRLCYTDIIFEHTFHSVKVNERYLLDNLTLENVIVSFHCTVVGLYNESGWFYKNTNNANNINNTNSTINVFVVLFAVVGCCVCVVVLCCCVCANCAG